MYGSSSKLGRGGAAARGGGAKRPHSKFPPPPNRSSGASGGRLSLGGSSGGPRNRPGGASSAAPPIEETFSLVPGKSPLPFGMIIRLTPDLVDEIRRVEAQDGTPRIKFDANGNYTDGNVIDVGGKKFSFTWSREPADLCDIYEQRQSGEDGNGLLVESGSTWRKVNVKRDLDESATKHVKMRSEEAERKQKSRKAIILDHGNPSTKSQIKAVAAVETNTWRKFNQKKEPPKKKQKVEPPVVGPPKPAFKSGLASTTVAKSGRSASPLPSPPEQLGAPASPFGTTKIAKSHLNIEEIMPSQMKSKETEKETPSKAQETLIHRGNTGAKPKDLQSLLTTLLTENPKGMSLKALEKAVGDTIPNSAKKIEPIIKRIATFQAPGRYILKQGMDESFRKPPSDSGSSPEDNHHQTPAPEVKPVPEDKYDQTPAREASVDGKFPTGGLEEHTQLIKVGDEINTIKHINTQQHSPNPGGVKRGSSSSGSDSDSESDSSDSGSDSKSRSQSPANSGSSSDSESDASSNSKEGSDEDVDIMTSDDDDDKEPKHKPQASEQNGIDDEKQDARIHDAIVVVEKDLEETKPVSPDCQNIIERLFEDEENTVKDSFKIENCDGSERISKGKSRRGFDSEHAKRLKAENLAQPPESPQAVTVKSSSDFNPLGQRSVGRKYSDKSAQQENLSMVKDKAYRDSSSNNRSGVDIAPLVNGRSSILQREVSELELGELREPLPEEPPPRRKFERKSSFKQSENRLNASENLNLDSGKGKSIGRTILDSVKPSPAGLEGSNRKKTPEHVEEVTRSHNQVVSRADHAEVGSQSNKASDLSSKFRHDDSTAVQGNGMEGYGESQKKTPACGPQYNGSCSPYMKYEKDQPEPKGIIKDFSQYNEYVQEYREKYDSYCSLNKVLESDRIEFQKLGKDLESARDGDMDRYRNILEKLKESYRQCGERHKRLKKIFTVLHEELKYLKQRIAEFALSYTKD